MLERRGRRKIQGLETIKQRTREREQSQTRVELSVSQSAKSAWQPAGSPAIRRDTHSTLRLLCPQISCKLPLRKWVLWNGLGHDEDFYLFFFLAVTLSIIFNLGEEHTAIGTVRKLETLLRWQKTRLSYVHPRPRWRASGDAFSFFFKCTSATLSCGYRDSMTSDFFVLPFSYLCKLRMMLRIERIGSNGSSVRSYGERSPNFLS